MSERLGPDARRTAMALAWALLPPSRVFAGADDRTVDRLEHLVAGFGPGILGQYEWLLAALEQAPRLTHGGRPFSRLTREEAETYLAGWVDAVQPKRGIAQLLTFPLKIAYFDDPAIYAHFGSTYRTEAAAEKPSWWQQVTRGAELESDAELECDAVVVGTGAGGAVVAKELAERGLAVLLLEEGEYRTRADFVGDAVAAFQNFYRERGLLATLGNGVIPLPAGRLVGGSTAVNTATCWRTPDWVLARWVEEGLADLSPDKMAPYFDRVERELEVEPVDPRYAGGAARVVARGCDVLGYSHLPVRRNAPGCDGAGVCDLGCPTDARRSMNVSYVPSALKRGAELWTGVRVERVLVERGRAVGVEGRAGSRRVTVRARAVVLACGTVPTPILLMQQGLGRGLRHLGRNLSIHPATMVSALFDESIRGFASIPQSHCVNEFQKSEGILLLGASAPIDIGAAGFAFVGKRLMEVMESYDRIASFGVMVEDASRGRVTFSRDGRPRVLYWLGEEERHRLLRGTEIVSRIFLAGGAREVYPPVRGHRLIRGAADLQRLARARTAGSDWLLTAFHPLGTCRMATSPSKGVVSPDHELFGVPDLFVIDGSTVPSAVAVNPQVTIMALATRAADKLAERLEKRSASPMPVGA